MRTPQDVAFLSMRNPLMLWFTTCRTVVSQDLLQLYESLKLSSPTIALTAFVKGLADAHERTHLQQVSGSTRYDLP